MNHRSASRQARSSPVQSGGAAFFQWMRILLPPADSNSMTHPGDWRDEFYKSWLTASLAPTTVGGHQEPFQLTSVEVQLLRGPIHALSASEAAAAEFQKILRHRGIVGNNAIGALAHLGLARTFSLSGDGAKGRAAYQDFFAIWKDADPEIPILRQAKAEYANLNTQIAPRGRRGP
jgi:hypothetical protein